MATYFIGTAGSATFKSVDFKVSKWDFTDEVEEVNTTNMGSSGRKTWLAGVRSGSGSFEAFYDDDLSYGSPLAFIAGASGTISLAVDASAPPSISGTAIVKSCNVTHELNGVTKFVVSFGMTGTFLNLEEA